MVDKKKVIIAAIVFIFLGLVVFSFANSGNNEDPETNNPPEQQEQDEQKNQEEDNEKEEETVKPVVSKDYYEDALAAVIKAEEELEITSYEAALKLVAKVKSSKKAGLDNRLVEVKNSIDAKEVVKTLSEMVSSALDKEDMEEARTYRTEQDVLEKVESLLNETLKGDLQKELEALAKLLDDVNSPVVNIEDGAILSEKTEIIVEDANEFILELQKDEEESKKIDNNYELTEEGVYTLTLTDKAFNSYTIKFTLDLSNPIFNIEDGIYSNKDINVEISDLTFDYVEIQKDLEEATKNTENKFTLTEEGVYKLTAYDKALHSATITVTVDKTAPVITLKEYLTNVEGVVVEPGVFEYSVTAFVEDTNIDTIKLNNEDFVSGTEIKDENSYTLVGIDKAGNITAVNFTVDTEAPTVEIDGEEYKDTVEDTLYYNKAITPVITDQSLETVILNNEEYVLGTEISEDGTYTLTATDSYGRTTTMTIVIDKTLPVITLKKYTLDGSGEVLTPGMHEYSVIALVDDANIDTVKLNDIDYVSGTEIKDENSYVLVVTDKAGNSVTVEFAVDTDAPAIGIDGTNYRGERNETVYINKSFIPEIIDQSLETVTLNGEEYVLGTELTEEGTYTFVATDSHGRTTTLTVIVDKTLPVVTLKKYTKDNKGKEVVPGVYNFSLVAFAEDTYLDTVKLNDEDYVLGTEIGARKSYTLVVTDKAGNSTTIEFAVDKDAPYIIIDGKKYKEQNGYVYPSSPIIPEFEDSNLDKVTLNGEDYEIGTEITGDGVFELVAVDKAGNKTTVNLVVGTMLVHDFESLKKAFETGGNIKLMNDIEVDETLLLKKGIEMTLDMNGKKLTLADQDSEGNPVDPMIDMKTGSSLVITGNGTVDLEDHYYATFIFPRGDVTIENGTFLRDSGGTGYGSFFVGISGGKGKLIIKDGYFDGGYYDTTSNEFHNSRNLLNLSWGQYVRVYGGTFVGQNPAYGDEGMAHTNLTTSTYCQGVFFEGQHWKDTEIPSTYTVTESVTTDGTNRPVYTVTYTP